MKTSLILGLLLLFNATAILADPISKLTSSFNVFVLIAIEIVLISAYVINTIIKDIRSVMDVEFDNLNFYPKSSQGKNTKKGEKSP